MNALGKRNQYCLRISNGLAEPEPGSQRDALDRFDRRVPQVDRHQTKSTGLDQEVGYLDSVFYVSAAADPHDLG